MPIHIGTECGQKWYRLHSWYCFCYPRGDKYRHTVKAFRFFRNDSKIVGFAIGPIMVWWG